MQHLPRTDHDRAILALVNENLALRCALALHRPEFATMPGATPPRLPASTRSERQP
ncbi:hypothetical protein [Roseinatronobacter bogoriensis]|uniref:hypothetical protein n=1 Tax=Roseinatronobacter bogoriensis TaxID=119542 RepID=UPI0010EA0201|nr:hypothetical protein [Rhodobaca bogoriensis]MBB4207237.1 hypothetical protein [Rhodobaca bogoriensis DSM 18756]TDY65738.1 hypothetical protein EV660_1176 [Rhodobaca bogoriensis DSM 18756]